MSKEILEGKTYSFNRIETTLEKLRKSEDEPINQLINGVISVDAYCHWLVGNGKLNSIN